MNKKLLTIVLVLAVVFYWYEIRPANIRSKCNKKVLMERQYSTTKFEKDQLGGDMNRINKVEREKTDFWYKDCLRDNGLKE